jgi:prevent-host-death family protein
MEYWSIGVLECWSVGVLECWKFLGETHLSRLQADKLAVNHVEGLSKKSNTFLADAWLTFSIPEVVYFVTVINLNEAKAHLGKYVAKAAKGEVIVLCERNRPVAELRAISGREEGRPVKLGVLKGAFKVTENFDAPVESFEKEFYSSKLKP